MNNQTSNPQAQEPTAVDTIPEIEPSAIAAIAEAAPLIQEAQAASAIALIQEVPAENVTEQAAITPEATPANPSGTLTTMDVADLLKIPGLRVTVQNGPKHASPALHAALLKDGASEPEAESGVVATSVLDEPEALLADRVFVLEQTVADLVIKLKHHGITGPPQS
jgi:hypothetical protein